MKAICKHQYGGPEVLRMEEVPIPQPKGDEVLIQVMANSANPADWHILRGKPYFARFTFGLFKPKNPVLGSDFSGIVKAIGPEVKSLNIGDYVFGEKLQGAFAEFCVLSASVLAKMPSGSSFEDMAALPIAGLTAYQALLEHGKLKQGESVLINGASGGVGHFAVQIAKAYGAEVAGICSSKNVEFVKSLGADDVYPYDKSDLNSLEKQFDLVIDCFGNLKHQQLQALGKRGVLVGFTKMGHMLKVLLNNAFSNFSLKQFTAEPRREELEILANLVSSKQLKPKIAKIYPAEEIPAAIAFIEQMRTPGKVVMRWKQ